MFYIFRCSIITNHISWTTGLLIVVVIAGIHVYVSVQSSFVRNILFDALFYPKMSTILMKNVREPCSRVFSCLMSYPQFDPNESISSSMSE